MPGLKKKQNEGEVTVTVKGIYVPYEQNFVPGTMFCCCPKQQCIMRRYHNGPI